MDALGQTNYLLGRAHFPKQAPAKPPKPVPRPGQEAEVKGEDAFEVTPEELAEFLKNPI